MISEMEWNQVLRNPDVHELARQAATLLQSRGLTTPVAGVMDWALELALGGRQISIADYYAAGFLILNPWMWERVARKIHKRHPAEHSAKGTIPPEALRQRWERRSGLLKRWSQSVGVHTGISGRARAYEDMLSWLNQIPWTADMLPQIKQELLTLIEHSGQDVEDWREKNASIRNTSISGSSVQLELSRARAYRRELRKALKELQEVMDMLEV